MRGHGRCFPRTPVRVPVPGPFREDSDENRSAVACGVAGRASDRASRPGADARHRKSALSQAVQQRVSQDQADREAILSLLQRPEVKQIAAQAGLSLQKAEAAVSTLNGQDLRDLAAQSRQVQNDLAGGASTIVISTTTIIIVLLIVILIVLIAD